MTNNQIHQHNKQDAERALEFLRVMEESSRMVEHIDFQFISFPVIRHALQSILNRAEMVLDKESRTKK